MNEIKESFIGNEAVIIIEKVLKRISHEIRNARHKKQEVLTGLLEKLRNESENIESVLAGASKNSTSNKMLILWLEKIEKVVYEADDLLDEWAYDDLDRDVKIKRHSRKRVYDDALYPSLRVNRAGKVKALLDKIQGLYDEATRSGIEPVKAAGGFSEYFSSAEWREQQQRLIDRRLFVQQESLYGRDADFDHIKYLLGEASNGYHKLNVIGIVGMAGLGKTSLSRQIEKSQDMKGCLFDEVIFIVVSHDYGSIGDILKKVAKKVVRRKVESCEGMPELQEMLRGKKYLLILDDVWRSFPWDVLSNALDQIGGSKGTTILVTSRETMVVQNMIYENVEPHIHTLKALDEDDSWSLLLKNKITGDNNDLVDGEKKDIAKKLIRKCGGNPLAINVLGGLLRKNSDVKKWREFMKSKEWEKYDEGNVLASLKLSFSHLKSPTLKSCFSYCSVFREDEEINKDKLIRLWTGQGILPKREHVEMEVLGEECFNELLDSSLFQEPVVHYGVLVSVKMHDLVRELACDVSKRINAEEASSSSHKFSRSRLNVWVSSLPLSILHYQKLRVFSFKMYVNDDSVVRVNKAWNSLAQLRHLRFLNITVDLTGVEKSRASEVIEPIYNPIAILYHLQTLTIRGSINEEDMPHLPKDFCNLVNLRHFQMDLYPKKSSIGIIEGFGNLTNLQTLPRIDLSKGWGGKASELGNLSKLSGTLDISHINNEEEARSLNLGAKSCLEALHVRYTWDNEVLEALKPVDSLNGLKIDLFKGTSLPTWLTSRGFSLSKLTKLSLVWCQQATGELNMGNFPRLRYLKLIECQELTMVFPEKGFECCQLLEVLVIKSCSKVDSIPDLSPLTKLRTLFFHNNGIKPNSTSKLHGLDGLQCSKVKTHAFLLPTTTITQDSPICKSLNALDIDGDPDVANTIPDQLQHFVALRFLRLSGYTEQEGLHDHLIENMKSLEAIYLENMPKLECLPSETTRRRFTNLRTIAILACHSLLQGYHNKEDVPSEEESGRRTTTICFSENSKTHPDEFCLRQYLYTSPYIDIHAEWDKEFRKDQDVICRIRDGN